MTTEGKPCRLQINTAGAWRNVLDFDADKHGDQVQEHAASLGAIIDAKLRIITADGLQQVLLYWDSKRGWHDPGYAQ